MPANVIIALLGVLGMAFFLSWETIGLDAAVDMLVTGPILPGPFDALAEGLYQVLHDWQILIAAGLLLWGARALLPLRLGGEPSARPVFSEPSRWPENPPEDRLRGSAIRRLDAALRQLEFATEALKLEIRNSVQGSFLALQVRSFLSLPSPGLDSLNRDIGVLDTEVIYLFYRLLSKLETVRAVNIESTGKHIIALTEEVEAIMHHLRTAAFQDAATGELLPWPSTVTPRAAEPRRRARQETI